MPTPPVSAAPAGWFGGVSRRCCAAWPLLRSPSGSSWLLSTDAWSVTGRQRWRCRARRLCQAHPPPQDRLLPVLTWRCRGYAPNRSIGCGPVRIYTQGDEPDAKPEGVGSVSSIEQQALSWRKSSACANGDCVEVAYGEDRVLVRNSRTADIILEVPRSRWPAFLADVIAQGRVARAHPNTESSR